MQIKSAPNIQNVLTVMFPHTILAQINTFWSGICVFGLRRTPEPTQFGTPKLPNLGPQNDLQIDSKTDPNLEPKNGMRTYRHTDIRTRMHFSLSTCKMSKKTQKKIASAPYWGPPLYRVSKYPSRGRQKFRSKSRTLFHTTPPGGMREASRTCSRNSL